MKPSARRIPLRSSYPTEASETRGGDWLMYRTILDLKPVLPCLASRAVPPGRKLCQALAVAVTLKISGQTIRGTKLSPTCDNICAKLLPKQHDKVNECIVSSFPSPTCSSPCSCWLYRSLRSRHTLSAMTLLRCSVVKVGRIQLPTDLRPHVSTSRCGSHKVDPPSSLARQACVRHNSRHPHSTRVRSPYLPRPSDQRQGYLLVHLRMQPSGRPPSPSGGNACHHIR